MPAHAVRVACDPPFDWAAALAFLRARAIDGVERADDGAYRRTIRLGRSRGTLTIRPADDGGALLLELNGIPETDVEAVIRRVRHMFDLDADLGAIAAHLARDPWLAARMVQGRVPRVLRGWDGFEVAARTIVGQQITVAGARRLNGVLVERCGASGASPGLDRFFPTPRELLAADLSAIGMPRARVAALRSVAEAAADNPRLFDRGPSADDTVARLRTIRGIGDWSAHYIAMRACGEPDAFPASDVGLLRGAADADRTRPSPVELRARAEAWRPWRAYAAHQLWAVDSARQAAAGSRSQPARAPSIRSQAAECGPRSGMRQ